MSPSISMPPLIHWPEPPNSGWLNCAIVPPPACTACSITVTASVLKPWRAAIEATA